jgi:hypothetical protein
MDDKIKAALMQAKSALDEALSYCSDESSPDEGNADEEASSSEESDSSDDDAKRKARLMISLKKKDY